MDIPKWSFPDEGITALTGPSGSGKTTLVRLLCGLLPCKGLVWNFKNQDLAKIPCSARRLGVVFQDLHLFPHLSVKDNILFAAKARNLSRQEVEKDFETMLGGFQLERKISLTPEQLSGGEKQRVALARALIGQPQFLFLDEPFSNLDEQTKNLGFELIKKMFYKRPLPTLLISHNSQDLSLLAERVFYLEKGRLKS